MSMATFQDAMAYLRRREKEPKRTESGRWRWTLPDTARDHAADELPAPIFNRLQGGDHRFPWLFDSANEAQGAAVAATRQALEAGEIVA